MEQLENIKLHHGDIKVGDYVRNLTTGRFARVDNISPDHTKIYVHTITGSPALWRAHNVELIKDAKH